MELAQSYKPNFLSSNDIYSIMFKISPKGTHPSTQIFCEHIVRKDEAICCFQESMERKVS